MEEKITLNSKTTSKGFTKKDAQLQDQLLEAIDKDTEAFNVVSAVFDLPKETEEEKATRREAMQQALKQATESPFSMMELIVEALEPQEAVAVQHQCGE